MCRVLIVDDHESITTGISKMIERVAGIRQSVYTANSGSAAEELALRINPDIVFTDIRMPDFSGIELVSRLKKGLKDTRYVIMSGYDDFTYARDALRLGVVDYLLKPIDREDVERLVRESLEFLENRSNRNAADKEKILDNNAYEITLCELFDDMENSNLVEKLKNEGMEFGHELCTVLVFEKDTPLESASSEVLNDDNAIHSKVKKICKEYLNMIGTGNIVFSNFNNQIVTVINHERLKVMEKIASELILRFQQELGIKMSCGIGNAVSNFDCLKASYNNAKTSIKYKLLYGATSCTNYKFVENRKNDEISNSSIFKHLVTCIETHDQRGIEKGINYIFLEFCNNNRFSIESLISACHALYLYSVKTYNYSGEYILTEEDFCNVFRSLYSVRQVNDFVRESIVKVCEVALRDDISFERKKIIEKALKFIHENYHKDISLAYVANYLSRNYTYFSKLFKNETGLCFSDYLREFRIEKAKELIRDTDKKILDVAKAVGFGDNVHFCKSFSQKVGMSPNKYREKVR